MGDILYLECASGISGDMTVAALLDLGADEQVLRDALESLPVEGFQVQVSRVVKSGLDVCDFNVLLDEGHENHDHDMAYLHGGAEADSHSNHSYGDGQGHCHGHDGERQEHLHHCHHEHRGLPEILEIIRQAKMTVGAKELSERIFRILAQAEAKAHGVPVGQVHFHEVGAVDSIVDILGAAVCLDNLGITDVVVPKLFEGKGMIRCRHGLLPVPVPAVLNIVQEYGLPMEIIPVDGELVTPTGAAIVAAVRTSGELPGKFVVKKSGMGAGKREYATPGILRVMLLEAGRMGRDVIWKLEANIDDSTGEMLGYAMERLLREGARDVHYTPAFMKKNRPSYQLNVICDEIHVPKLEEIIFQETTTIGIRKMPMERSTLRRELREVQTSLGPVAVKVCASGPEEWVYPEYESIAKLARQHHMPFREVNRAVAQEVGKICK